MAKKTAPKSETSKSGTAGHNVTSAGQTSHTSHTLVDHDEIREWAEERGARPACVRGTGNKDDVGMIRLDFPGYTGEESLEEVSWDEWFEKFDERGLALLVQDNTAGGQRSNFNKLVSQETAEGGKPHTWTAQ
jgi:hypothetical protein